MKKHLLLLSLVMSTTVQFVFAQCQCNDGIDNDGDGLVDWEYDLGCIDSTDCSEGGKATRTIENGWTVIEPASDSRIIYVSSSTGNDAGNGLTPQTAKQTIAAAYALTRANYSDWILLKRGDVFVHQSLNVRYGRSRTEPFVVASYGSSLQRPLLKTDSMSGINVVWHFQNVIISGISFYANTRDPNSSEYRSGAPYGQDQGLGFYFFRNLNASGHSLLLEGCEFNFYKGNVVQGQSSPHDIVIRRNIFKNNYSTNGHSQGLYSSNVDTLLLEQNIFDHNGWYMQQTVGGQSNPANGMGTMYNHNTYFSGTKNVTFRENIFMRPSSMCNKFTANSGIASTSNITIDNNLYIDGEIGISMGGNVAGTLRFKNINVTNNVMTDIGRSWASNRGLAWSLDIQAWDGGTVSNNLFLHQPKLVTSNTYAIAMTGSGLTRNVTLENNVIHGMYTNNRLVVLDSNQNKQNIIFRDNKIQSPYYNAILMTAPTSLTNYTFTNNTYYSALTASQWFRTGSTSIGFSAWQTLSSETGSSSLFAFCDTTRRIETYQASIGQTPSIDAFIAEQKMQSRYNWRNIYTADVINDWMRVGFTTCATGGVGVEENKISANAFLVNNPFQNTLTINFKEIVKSGELLIYSLNGSLVYKENIVASGDVNINTESWPTGLYLARMTTNNSNNIVKLIKQ